MRKVDILLVANAVTFVVIGILIRAVLPQFSSEEKPLIVDMVLLDKNENFKPLHSVINDPIKCGGISLNTTLVMFGIGSKEINDLHAVRDSHLKNIFYFKDGKCMPVTAFMPNNDIRNSLTWVRLAAKIIDAGMAKNVLIISLGLRMENNEGFNSKSDFSQRLEMQLEQLKINGIPVSIFLLDPKINTNVMSVQEYIDNLTEITKVIRNKNLFSQILIANDSRGFGIYKKEIEQAQLLLSQNYTNGIFPGADIKKIEKKYFIDECCLSYDGEILFDILWLQAINDANDLFSLLRSGF